MATSKKKTSGTGLLSSSTDPLRVELDEIFVGYPEGAMIAYGFLLTETDSPFIQLDKGKDIWRVRRDAVDRYVNGETDRVKLKWAKKNSHSVEP